RTGCPTWGRHSCLPGLPGRQEGLPHVGQHFLAREEVARRNCGEIARRPQWPTVPCTVFPDPHPRSGPMPEDSPFRDLIRRVRAGDEQAAVELLHRYEPAIRRTVRARLRDSQLRRLLDSLDLSQAVLASFFVNVALGRYELERPEDLLQLLTSMAHHKLTDEARKHQAGRRDRRRVVARPVEELDVLVPGSRPSQPAATHQL